MFACACGPPPLFLQASLRLFLPECERKAVGVLIQSCWHTFLTSRGGRLVNVSLMFATHFPWNRLKAGLGVRCAKCINATIFSWENKLHIYSFGHDFVLLRASSTQCSVISLWLYRKQRMRAFGWTGLFLWHDWKRWNQTQKARTRHSSRGCLIARSCFPALPQSCVNCAEMFSKNNDGFAWPDASVTSAPCVFRKPSHCETWGEEEIRTWLSQVQVLQKHTQMQHLNCGFYSILNKGNSLCSPVHCRALNYIIFCFFLPNVF